MKRKDPNFLIGDDNRNLKCTQLSLNIDNNSKNNNNNHNSGEQNENNNNENNNTNFNTNHKTQQFSDILPDILEEIVSFLDNMYFVNCVIPRVCQNWYDIISSNQWWLNLANSRYGIDVWDGGNIEWASCYNSAETTTKINENEWSIRKLLALKERLGSMVNHIDEFNSLCRPHVLGNKSNETRAWQNIETQENKDNPKLEKESLNHDSRRTELPLQVLQYYGQPLAQDLIKNSNSSNNNHSDNNNNNRFKHDDDFQKLMYLSDIIRRMLKSTAIIYHKEDIEDIKDIQDFESIRNRSSLFNCSIKIGGIFIDAQYRQQFFSLCYEGCRSVHEPETGFKLPLPREFIFAGEDINSYKERNYHSDSIHVLDQISDKIGLEKLKNEICNNDEEMKEEFYFQLFSMIETMALPSVLGDITDSLDFLWNALES